VRPTTDEENITITMVDDILKRTQQQLGSAREVSFEDLVEQIEEIPQNTYGAPERKDNDPSSTSALPIHFSQSTKIQGPSARSKPGCRKIPKPR